MSDEKDFMRSLRAFDYVTEQPWLMTEDSLQKLLAIAQRAHEPGFLQQQRSQSLARTETARVRDGVAIIPITGPIFRYANLFTDMSGATSTQVLSTDIRAAIDDPQVRAIILEINSPGGQAAGINELAQMIFEARDRKRIIAYGDGNVASAAYWLASAADEIVVDRTTIGGSIGARMTIVDTSGRDAKAGVRTFDIVSSQSPDKALDITQDSGRAKIQKIVDDLAGVFVETVARNRGTDVATVLANYGQGGLKTGDALIEAGMADRLGSLEQLLVEHSASRPLTRSYAMSKPATNKGPVTVATTAELHAALVAGHLPEEISVKTTDVEAIKADATKVEREAGEKRQTEAVAKASTDATNAERGRVAGIMKLNAKGFEAEIKTALESGATPEATAMKCMELAGSRGVTVAALEADGTKAAPHGGAAVDPALAPKKSPWAGVVSRFNGKNRKSA